MIVVCTLAVKIPDEVFLNLHKTQAAGICSRVI